tara:strand:- start:995 stop:1453 length:459 start_codon:yes stop_codon:yes gene_type:complete
MSTIFADKFKNTSGGNPVQINQLRGIDTAGSITVQGEGTATTNLQQGLAKTLFNLNSMSTLTSNHSLNVSSLDDDGTGDFGVHYTNNMGDANYILTHAVNDGGASTALFSVDMTYGTNTTSAVDIEAVYTTGGSRTNGDGYGWMMAMHGDLA